MTFDRSLVEFDFFHRHLHKRAVCVCGLWPASTMFHDSPKVVVVEEPGWTTMAFLTFRILCRQWISEGPQMLWQFRVCTRIHFLRFIGMDDGKAHTHHNQSNVIRTIYELVCTGSGFLTGHFFGTSPPKSYIWLRWESAVGCLNSRDTPISLAKWVHSMLVLWGWQSWWWLLQIQPQHHCAVGYEEILFEALDRYDEALLGQRRFSRECFFFGQNTCGFCCMNMQHSGKHIICIYI